MDPQDDFATPRQPIKPQNFPALKAPIPMTCPPSVLIDSFKKASSKHGFYISQVSKTSVTAIYNRKSVLHQLFSCLASQDKPEKKISIVKFSIRSTQRASNSVVVVRGLQGLTGKIASVIETFKLLTETVFSKSVETQIRGLNSDPDLVESVMVRNIENYSYYELAKVLASRKHGVGNALYELITQWSGEHREKSGPQALCECKKAVDETVLSLLSHFKATPFSAGKIAQHCRPNVERFLYSKLLKEITALYQEKYAETNESFKLRRDEIRVLGKSELLGLLEVKPKFRLQGLTAPYEAAIEALDQLGSHQTPLDKLNCILHSMTFMKTCVVDHWKGREELKTMDDRLPVVIYIVSQTTVAHLPSQIRLLQDYIAHSAGFDNEQRILIDLDSSVSYILHELFYD